MATVGPKETTETLETLRSLPEVSAEPDWGPDPIVDEAARVQALRACRILDTPREEEFDRITSWARDHFQVPFALVTLIDADRQWIKSACGIEATETALDVAFCTHTIRHSRPMVVEDARLDPRFRDNPYVTGDPFIRFYAGMPLITADRYALGSLCLIDHEPRRFGITDRVLLARLAALVLTEIDARRP